MTNTPDPQWVLSVRLGLARDTTAALPLPPRDASPAALARHYRPHTGLPAAHLKRAFGEPRPQGAWRWDLYNYRIHDPADNAHQDHLLSCRHLSCLEAFAFLARPALLKPRLVIDASTPAVAAARAGRDLGALCGPLRDPTGGRLVDLLWRRFGIAMRYCDLPDNVSSAIYETDQLSAILVNEEDAPLLYGTEAGEELACQFFDVVIGDTTLPDRRYSILLNAFVQGFLNTVSPPARRSPAPHSFTLVTHPFLDTFWRAEARGLFPRTRAAELLRLNPEDLAVLYAEQNFIPFPD